MSSMFMRTLRRKYTKVVKQPICYHQFKKQLFVKGQLVEMPGIRKSVAVITGLQHRNSAQLTGTNIHFIYSRVILKHEGLARLFYDHKRGKIKILSVLKTSPDHPTHQKKKTFKRHKLKLKRILTQSPKYDKR